MTQFSLTDYFGSTPAQPDSEKYYSLVRGEDLMQVHRHAINLVLGRNLRRNVSYSAVMARELATKGDRVLYLNTYAGRQLLMAAFEYDQASRTGQDDQAAGELRISDLATGEWNLKDVTDLVEQKDVLIINSFEFAALTRALKDRVGLDIIDLQKKTGITIVIFSHSLQLDLEAGCGGRGALGVLAAVAESVSRVGEEWLIRARNMATILPGALGEKVLAERAMSAEYAGKARVHEKRTLNTYNLPRKFGGERPNPTVDIPNDRGFSCHYGDFWCNPFERGPYADYTGRAMSLLARTPLLQQYLLDNPDKKFMVGNTPTEAKLMAERTLA